MKNESPKICDVDLVHKMNVLLGLCDPERRVYPKRWSDIVCPLCGSHDWTRSDVVDVDEDNDRPNGLFFIELECRNDLCPWSTCEMTFTVSTFVLAISLAEPPLFTVSPDSVNYEELRTMFHEYIEQGEDLE